eukprot:1105322-Pelagomonas_calceolata.AAC.1
MEQDLPQVPHSGLWQHVRRMLCFAADGGPGLWQKCAHMCVCVRVSRCVCQKQLAGEQRMRKHAQAVLDERQAAGVHLVLRQEQRHLSMGKKCRHYYYFASVCMHAETIMDIGDLATQGFTSRYRIS